MSSKPARSRPARARAPLTRERVLETALALADEGGIESLTMRKLGQALGVEAMSLYNHVANKDDILGAVVDVVLAETEAPSPEGDWETAIRRSAISVHDALTRHPWAVALLMSPERAQLSRMLYMDKLLGRLREAGFSADVTYHAYHVLDGHIFGFSLWQASHTFKASDLTQLAERFFREFPLDDYPYVKEHVEQHMHDGPHRAVGAFEFGLDLIIDGLKRLREAG
jgi:AcrR family transcriptional regulator